MNNPMNFLQDIIRRGAHLVGWEIGEAIEGVMWTVGIGCQKWQVDLGFISC